MPSTTNTLKSDWAYGPMSTVTGRFIRNVPLDPYVPLDLDAMVAEALKKVHYQIDEKVRLTHLIIATDAHRARKRIEEMQRPSHWLTHIGDLSGWNILIDRYPSTTSIRVLGEVLAEYDPQTNNWVLHFGNIVRSLWHGSWLRKAARRFWYGINVKD